MWSGRVGLIQQSNWVTGGNVVNQFRTYLLSTLLAVQLPVEMAARRR